MLILQLSRPPAFTMSARAVRWHASCVTDPLATKWKARPASGQVSLKSLQVHGHANSVYFSHIGACFAGFAQANQCNSVFGCVEEQQFERCTCYRDCGYDGDPVCGSDGQLYQNLCQMEVFACRNGTRMKQVPLSQCPQSKTAFVLQRPPQRYYQTSQDLY